MAVAHPDIEKEAVPAGFAGDEGYGDSSGKLWSVYLSIADKQDAALVETWRGDADGTLIFTGLFSATVAAFIIESYKNLSPDSNDTAVVLLGQILQQLASNGTAQPVLPPPNSTFHAPSSAVRVNVLWFLSLTLSLTCALAATLMQQWARRYQHLVQSRAAPHKRARLRAHLFDGVQRYRMSEVVETIPALLHVAVFLFFAGMVEFLFPINRTVAGVTLAFVSACASAYLLLTVLPHVRSNIPYRTPFSSVAIARALSLFSRMFSRRPPMHARAERLTAEEMEIDRKALSWTLAALEDDDDLESFLEGIPGFLQSNTVQHPGPTVESFLYTSDAMNPLILASRLILTCVNGSRGLKESARRRRALTCVTAVRHLTHFMHPKSNYFGLVLPTWDMLNLLKNDNDRTISSLAMSTAAMAAYHFMQRIKTGQIAFDRALSLALIDPPHEMIGRCDERDELICNGDIINLYSYVSGVVPLLLSEEISPADLQIVWDTIITIKRWVDFTPAATSPTIRTAFLGLWNDILGLARSKTEMNSKINTQRTGKVPNVVRVHSFESMRIAPAPLQSLVDGNVPVQDRWTRLTDLLRPVVGWLSLTEQKRDPDPLVALGAFVRSAHAAQHFLRRVEDGIIGYSAVKLASLVEPTAGLRDRFVQYKECPPDGYLVNIISLVSGVLPLLQSPTVAERSLDVLWDTLFQLRTGLDPAVASGGTQAAFVELWNLVHQLASVAEDEWQDDPAEANTHGQRRESPAMSGRSRWIVLIEYLRPIAEALPDVSEADLGSQSNEKVFEMVYIPVVGGQR
ncbi:hypothetical protein FA95DRAFT_54530 [Auriscalpium vulgare]|uniref:Uncharacterized protein n=1 Tax=Auriscalpium vulgare TaxID=40419 RepID=A0ACB8S7K6_9AGAM|nr:hypothetical protein FA95DRAFT_54530 [Auriscalpium vulgare]